MYAKITTKKGSYEGETLSDFMDADLNRYNSRRKNKLMILFKEMEEIL